jgi:transposase-like protein
MPQKAHVKCIRCGNRGRVRRSGRTGELVTYECKSCGSIFSQQALEDARRDEERELGGW